MAYIWTHHANQRLKDRKIAKHSIEQTLFHPDTINDIKKDTREFQKHIDERTFAAIVKRTDRGEQLVVSCWVNPPYPGTRDARKRSRYLERQKAGFWKKVWLTILDQLGL